MSGLALVERYKTFQLHTESLFHLFYTEFREFQMECLIHIELFQDMVGKVFCVNLVFFSFLWISVSKKMFVSISTFYWNYFFSSYNSCSNYDKYFQVLSRHQHQVPLKYTIFMFKHEFFYIYLFEFFFFKYTHYSMSQRLVFNYKRPFLRTKSY